MTGEQQPQSGAEGEPSVPGLTPRRISGFGWTPDLPDHRDLCFSVPMQLLTSLPKSVDLRPQCPPVYDQGRIGSCTANALAGAIQFDRLKNNQSLDFVPSRLFIYYNERYIEHDVPLDKGAQLRDGIKAVNKIGVCPESEWPYDDPNPLGLSGFSREGRETKSSGRSP